MTDTNRLRACIEAQGLKYKYLAKELGITPQALLLKIENDREFKVSEVDTLSKILGLTLIEKNDIFFCVKS